MLSTLIRSKSRVRPVPIPSPSTLRSSVPWPTWTVRLSKLLDGCLEGVVPIDPYRAKSDEMAERRRTFERGKAGWLMASYQLKRPFESLRRDPKGAFRIQWWAILDLNQ